MNTNWIQKIMMILITLTSLSSLGKSPGKIALVTSIDPVKNSTWFTSGWDIQNDLTKKFVEKFNSTGYQIVIKPLATSDDLAEILQDPDMVGVFFVSHGLTTSPNNNNKDILMYSPSKIVDYRGYDLKHTLLLAHPQLQYLAVVGCNTELIFDKAFYKDKVPSQLVVKTFLGKIPLKVSSFSKAETGLEMAIKDSESTLLESTKPARAKKWSWLDERTDSSKKIKITVSRPSSGTLYPGVTLLARDKAIGYIPSSNRSEDLELLVDPNLNIRKIQVISGAPISEVQNNGLGAIEFKDQNGGEWKLVLDSQGQPLGVDTNTYVLSTRKKLEQNTTSPVVTQELPEPPPKYKSNDIFNGEIVGQAAFFAPIFKPGQTQIQFKMGDINNDAQLASNDQLPHDVILTKPIEIQTTPVTQLQWYMLMQDTEKAFASYARYESQCDINNYEEIPQQGRENNPKSPFSICKNHPVESISADEADLFISRLNQLQNQYTYRLPTEAEWEYVARQGGWPEQSISFNDINSNSDIKKSPAFLFIATHAWLEKDPSTHEVATKLGTPSPGDPQQLIYDLYGNVLQWLQDSYEKNFGLELSTDEHLRPVVDPIGLRKKGPYRASRGSTSHIKYLNQIKVSARFRYTSNIHDKFTGFRLVRALRKTAQ